MGSLLANSISNVFAGYGKYFTWGGYYLRVDHDPQPSFDDSDPAGGEGKPDDMGTDLPEEMGGETAPTPGEAMQYDKLGESNHPEDTFQMSGQMANNLIREALANQQAYSPPDFSAMNISPGKGKWHGSNIGSAQPQLQRVSYYSAEHLIFQRSYWYGLMWWYNYFRYADHYDLYIWRLKIVDVVRFQLWECKDGEPSLPDGWYEMGKRCEDPLPPIELGKEYSGGGSTRKRKGGKKCMCGCDCATIADLLDRQSEQTKEMFESQNKEIGAGLTEQTKFLKEQMVALAPKGFDYKPILDGQQDVKHDIINALWNGLPFDLNS